MTGKNTPLERRPESAGRRETFKEELQTLKVDQDKEIIQVAQKLFIILEQTPSGEKYIQQAMGNYIAQADRGSIATVTISQEPTEKE